MLYLTISWCYGSKKILWMQSDLGLLELTGETTRATRWNLGEIENDVVGGVYNNQSLIQVEIELASLCQDNTMVR